VRGREEGGKDRERSEVVSAACGKAAGGIAPRRLATQQLWWFFFLFPGRGFRYIVALSVLSTAVRELSCLRAVVEVVPVVAGAHPVVVGGGVVGLVVGVGRGVVELAGLGVLAGGLGVQGGGGLTVESLEHLREGAQRRWWREQQGKKPYERGKYVGTFAITHDHTRARSHSRRRRRARAPRLRP
jgi:hypothetical protein